MALMLILKMWATLWFTKCSSFKKKKNFTCALYFEYIVLFVLSMILGKSVISSALVPFVCSSF